MLKSRAARSSSSDANTLFRFCISAAPAALDRYLAAVPAMSLIPFAPFRCQRFSFSVFYFLISTFYFDEDVKCLDLTPFLFQAVSLHSDVSVCISAVPAALDR